MPYKGYPFKETSLEAYHLLQLSKAITKKEKKVVYYLYQWQNKPSWRLQYPDGMTQSEISAIDVDAHRGIGPRFSNLVSAQVIYIVGKRPCTSGTNRSVFVYQLTGNQPQPYIKPLTSPQAVDQICEEIRLMCAENKIVASARLEVLEILSRAEARVKTVDDLGYGEDYPWK